MILFSDVNKSRYEKVDEIIALANDTKAFVEAWVLTANDEATYENFRHEYQLALPYFYADGTVIKAMIRANPGLILMKDGVVLGKWHNNDIPTQDEIMKLIQDHS